MALLSSPWFSATNTWNWWKSLFTDIARQHFNSVIWRWRFVDIGLQNISSLVYYWEALTLLKPISKITNNHLPDFGIIYLFELVCKYDSIEAKNPIRSSTFSTFFTLSCLRLSMLGYISIFDKSFEHKTIYLSFIKAGQGFDNITKLLNVWKTLKHLTD